MIVRILLCLYSVQYSLADLILQIPNGKLQGTTFFSPNGRTFYSWRGIPYAQPPLGELRFMAPLKASPWKGVLNATIDRKACHCSGIPYIEPSAGYSEDCLFINVYSPEDVNEKTAPDRPVLFWIHGGALQLGSGDFVATDPTPFLEQGIVVVTCNYRLTSLGFLSTQDEVILGNAGLKDQRLALIWTKENIGFFGGNPDDVTIMGESAGGMSVGYQIVSPKSKGLFKGAIMQSGNSLTDFFKTPSEARHLAYLLAKKIEPSITDSNSSIEVKNVLQEASVKDLIRFTDEINVRFSTVLEVESDGSFLTKPMYESLENGNFNRVPLIIGYNSEECLVWYSDENALKIKGKAFDANPALLISRMPLKDGVDKKKISEEIKELYIKKNESFSQNLAAVLSWHSDNRFVRTTYKQALLQSKYVPVYLYRLSFYGTPSQEHFLIPGAGKVGHGADIPYFFNVSRMPLKTAGDFLTRQRLVTLWSNFVKTSNPTPADSRLSKVLQNVVWQAITANNVLELEVGDNLELRKSEKVKEIPFWDHIWNTYSYRPYNTF